MPVICADFCSALCAARMRAESITVELIVQPPWVAAGHHTLRVVDGGLQMANPHNEGASDRGSRPI